MRERPIIFNREMVRAVMEGRKVQTRRIMKIQPTPSKTKEGDFWFPCKKMESMVHISDLIPDEHGAWPAHEFFSMSCPFGAVGDRLWVRETYGFEIRSVGGTPHEQIVYRASKPDAVRLYDCNGTPYPMKWTPSIYMRRMHSRITLEITGVRVERLTALSDDDARNEGCPTQLPHNPEDQHQARTWFRGLWSEIYGEESWQANPWVWVIEFKRVEGE